MTDLKPCPFCGIMPRLVITDDEGNLRNESYESDPFSGIAYSVAHNGPDVEEASCPAITDDNDAGPWIFEKKKEAIKAWNKRVVQ
jgi:hypothetical protein